METEKPEMWSGRSEDWGLTSHLVFWDILLLVQDTVRYFSKLKYHRYWEGRFNSYPREYPIQVV